MTVANVSDIRSYFIQCVCFEIKLWPLETPLMLAPMLLISSVWKVHERIEKAGTEGWREALYTVLALSINIITALNCDPILESVDNSNMLFLGLIACLYASVLEPWPEMFLVCWVFAPITYEHLKRIPSNFSQTFTENSLGVKTFWWSNVKVNETYMKGASKSGLFWTVFKTSLGTFYIWNISHMQRKSGYISRDVLTWEVNVIKLFF